MTFPPCPRKVLAAAVAALLAAGGALAAADARADRTHIAVAANFTTAAKRIAAAFAADTGHEAVLSFGSTGKLYAQIANGAPFQAFLAADAGRPRKAEAEGLAVPGTRFTYATGKIVLYSTDPALVDRDGTVIGNSDAFARLAIANPKTAPYGVAAVEAMTRLGVHDRVRGQIVRGDNIAQTYQFVATGNAQLGFVALSQVIGEDTGSRWVVPGDLHAPIRQDAVLLRAGADSAAARAFLDYLAGAKARAIIERHGYGIE